MNKEEDQMLINMVKDTVGYNESNDKKEFMKGVSVAIHIFRKELSKTNSLINLTQEHEMSQEDSQILFDADPNCNHTYDQKCMSGIKCNKCSGWFCY